jgi:hypothetical protein
MNTRTTMSSGWEYMRDGITGDVVTADGVKVGNVESRGGEWYVNGVTMFTTLWQAVRYIARQVECRDVSVVEHGRADDTERGAIDASTIIVAIVTIAVAYVVLVMLAALLAMGPDATSEAWLTMLLDPERGWDTLTHPLVSGFSAVPVPVWIGAAWLALSAVVGVAVGRAIKVRDNN